MKNPNRAFKDAIYEQFARIGKAVSSPKRLELLDLLCQGPRTVGSYNPTVCCTVLQALQNIQGANIWKTQIWPLDSIQRPYHQG